MCVNCVLLIGSHRIYCYCIACVHALLDSHLGTIKDMAIVES